MDIENSGATSGVFRFFWTNYPAGDPSKLHQCLDKATGETPVRGHRFAVVTDEHGNKTVCEYIINKDMFSHV